MMRKPFKILFSQAFIVVFLVVLQVVIIAVCVWKLSDYFVYLYSIFELISLGVVLHVISKKTNPAYKLAWAIPILLFPVFGGFFYLIVTRQRSARLLSRRLASVIDQSSPYLTQNEETIVALSNCSPYKKNFAYYMKNHANWPVYQNTTARYFPMGEDMFSAMMEELKEAKHYIFLEFFIIAEGYMWDSILNILAQKAKEGVDVRILYDSMGSLFLLPRIFPKKLEALGIHTKVFNPFVPYLSVVQNHRDHRKILVIDGQVAFTGGINVADEYINRKKLHGHWKDSGVMIRGEGVYSFTVMFLQMWQITQKMPEDYEKYRPKKLAAAPFKSDGFVLPYGDSPMDEETVGKAVYLDMVNKAMNYVHITTPYLVLDNEMITALGNAAKSGVDVKIITPHIEDRWYMHIIAWNFYRELILSGVRIYEYTPGFIHCKTFVCDDETAVVGSINFDYRSFYLHFECACWFYRNSVAIQVEEDFKKTLLQCQEITLDDCQKLAWYKKLLGLLLRILAPLL